MSEFSESSLRYNTSIPKLKKKEEGIFFTPKSIRHHLLSKIQFIPQNILEPSFGSGEFLRDCAKTWPTATIRGVEKDEESCPLKSSTH